MRQIIVLSAMALVLMLGIGYAASAQDATPTPAAGTPDGLECATPLSQASGSATPETTVIAATTAASPGGAEAGEVIGLFPCGTPTIVSSESTPAP